MNLNNKRVLITGASTGIGFHAAQALVREGATVFITGLPPEDEVRAAWAVVDGGSGRAHYAVMDLCDEASVADVMARAESVMGGIDILINNAGMALQQTVVEQTYARAEQEIRVNYLGTFLTTRLVLPGMLARRSGVILNVASTVALVPGPTQANYAASKAGVMAFTSALRSEVEDQGIRVQLFVPGLTSTGMTRDLKVKTPDLLDPAAVAMHMLKALRGETAAYITGASYRGFVWFSRLFPETARKVMKGYYQ